MMYELLATAAVAGSIWYLSSKSKPSVSNTDLNSGWKKKVVMAVVIISLFLAWISFSPSLATQLSDTDLGQRLEWSAESIETWLWVLGGLVALMVLYRLLPNRPKLSFPSGYTIERVSENVMGWVAFAVFAFIIVLGVGTVASLAGFDKAVIKTAQSLQGKAPVVQCTEQDELDRLRVTTKGRSIVFCPENGSLYVYATYGHRAVFTWQEKFRNEHPDEVKNWKVSDFVTIVDGPTTTSRRISPARKRTGPYPFSAFESSGLSHIVLYARAVQ